MAIKFVNAISHYLLVYICLLKSITLVVSAEIEGILSSLIAWTSRMPFIRKGAYQVSAPSKTHCEYIEFPFNKKMPCISLNAPITVVPVLFVSFCLETHL